MKLPKAIVSLIIIILIVCISSSLIFFAVHYNEHEYDVGHVENCVVCQFIQTNENVFKTLLSDSAAGFHFASFAFVLLLGIISIHCIEMQTPVFLKDKLNN